MEHTSFINSIPPEIISIFISLLVGLLVGIEREWSNKEAGVRTFALISLSGTILYMIGINLLIALGLIMVLIFSIFLAIQGRSDGGGLRLTTSISMLIVFGLGVIIGMEKYMIAVPTAIIVSALLFEKNTLHSFIGEINEKELKAGVKFGIIAFVIYPLLPEEPVIMNTLDLQLVWILIIAISGLGGVNYILMKKYEEKGMIVTSIFGGLVNSTATFVEISNKFKSGTVSKKDLVVSSLLTNASMTLRNILLLVIFLQGAGVYVSLPLVVILISAIITIGILFLLEDTNGESKESINTKIGSPFSLKQAGLFGLFFAIIIMASTLLNQFYGESSVAATMGVAGLVSSGSAITTVVVLVTKNEIVANTAMVSIMLATISSVAAKMGFILLNDRESFNAIVKWNAPLMIVGVISTAIIILT